MTANRFKKTISAVRRLPWVSLLLTATAAVVHLSYELRIQLIYDRNAVFPAELWRLVSCHWVHLSTNHLLWSAGTFLLLGALCEIMNRRCYYAVLGISGLAIPLVIHWELPNLNIYGGLSGVDCGLYALLMGLFIKRELGDHHRGWAAVFVFLLIGLLAKIIYETTTGQHLFVGQSHSSMTSVPLAHLVGGVVGCGVAIIKGPGKQRSSRCSVEMRG